jgi:hypothetical protein
MGGSTIAREPDSSVTRHDSKSTATQANENSVASDIDYVQPSVRAHGERTRDVE